MAEPITVLYYYIGWIRTTQPGSDVPGISLGEGTVLIIPSLFFFHETLKRKLFLSLPGDKLDEDTA